MLCPYLVITFVYHTGQLLTVIIFLWYPSYFDSHGNYYEKDDPDTIQDNWLTDVDWNKVKDAILMGLARGV